MSVCDHRPMTFRRCAQPLRPTLCPPCAPEPSLLPVAAKWGCVAHGVLWAAIAVCPAASRHATAAGFSDVVAITSQLFDRGIAIPPATPVLQNALFWTSETDWTIGVSAATPVRSPAQVVETTAQVSRHWSISDDWHMQASALVYEYPSERTLRSYDRAEAALGWTYRDLLTFQASTARMLHGTHDALRSAVDLDLRLPLRSDFFFAAGIGHAQALGAYRPSSHAFAGWYTYGHLGLGWGRDGWSFEVDRMANGQPRNPSPRPRTALNASQWAVTVSRVF
jgi:hypothetical protein